jgi:hypothetical protein
VEGGVAQWHWQGEGPGAAEGTEEHEEREGERERDRCVHNPRSTCIKQVERHTRVGRTAMPLKFSSVARTASIASFQPLPLFSSPSAPSHVWCSRSSSRTSMLPL